MPTHLPPPTVVPRAPVIPAEARLKVRLWRAPRRESIPFCRGDWSIARTPSTLFIPGKGPSCRARRRPHLPLCHPEAPRCKSASGGRDLGLASSNRRPPCPSHSCGGRLKVRLWLAPRRESIPLCRGDWSIARTPSTLFTPHPRPPSPVIPDPGREFIPGWGRSC